MAGRKPQSEGGHGPGQRRRGLKAGVVPVKITWYKPGDREDMCPVKKSSPQRASSDPSEQSLMKSHSGLTLVTHSPLSHLKVSSGHAAEQKPHKHVCKHRYVTHTCGDCPRRLGRCSLAHTGTDFQTCHHGNRLRRILKPVCVVSRLTLTLHFISDVVE